MSKGFINRSLGVLLALGVVCLAYDFGLFTVHGQTATAPADPDPTPNSEATQSDLTIYFPQDGPAVSEDTEYTVGSFTVANMNDTVGNGQPDCNHNSILAAHSNLTADAAMNATQVTVADGTQFPALVNGAPNRIRIRDDDNAELVYIKSVSGNVITLNTDTPLHHDYKFNKNGRAEVGEVDLMKLKMDSPKNTPASGNAVLTINSGNIKLWQDENKIAAVTMDTGSPTTYTFPVTQLPKIVWVECVETTVANLSIRGIKLSLKVGNDTDTVRATAVWATRSNFWTAAKVTGGVKTLNGTESDSTILNTFANILDGDLGDGTFNGHPPTGSVTTPSGPLTIGSREESEYVLYPNGLDAESSVTTWVSRQAGAAVYAVRGGNVPGGVDKMIPITGTNRFELANDDVYPSVDQDNKKTTETIGTQKVAHIYRIDGPWVPTTAIINDYQIRRVSFNEFVRFKFGPGVAFTQVPNADGTFSPNLDGTRGSPLSPWYFVLYTRRDVGDQGTSTAFTPVRVAISASQPQLGSINNATGTANMPTTVPTTITEGWLANYTLAGTKWTMTGSHTAPVIVGGASPWTIAVPNKVSFVITQAGAINFGDNDSFGFSSFKTSDAGAVATPANMSYLGTNPPWVPFDYTAAP